MFSHDLLHLSFSGIGFRITIRMSDNLKNKHANVKNQTVLVRNPWILYIALDERL